MVLKPIKENTKTASLEDTLSLKFPSKSVTAPLEVPFSTTLTPGIGN